MQPFVNPAPRIAGWMHRALSAWPHAMLPDVFGGGGDPLRVVTNTNFQLQQMKTTWRDTLSDSARIFFLGLCSCVLGKDAKFMLLGFVDDSGLGSGLWSCLTFDFVGAPLKYRLLYREYFEKEGFWDFFRWVENVIANANSCPFG